MLTRRTLLQAVPLLAVPLPARAVPKMVLPADLLEHIDYADRRAWQGRWAPLPEHRYFFTADEGSPYVMSWDMRPSVKGCWFEEPVIDPILMAARDLKPELRKRAVANRVVDEAIREMWIARGSFGSPHSGDRRTACLVDRSGPQVMAAFDGPVGYTAIRRSEGPDPFGLNGLFDVVVFPHLIRALWVE